MLAFKIGGKATLPPLPPLEVPRLNPPPSTASAAEIQHGESVFQRYCSACHGDVAVSGGVLPDLRYSEFLKNDLWFQVVRDGLLQSQGMVGFGKEVSREDAAAVRSYVIFRAHQTLKQAKEAATRPAQRKP
jgi:alcohol dehydrogenase (cytochrome c)/quinohemoprotein ethanol dehydrogenase